MYCQKLRNAGRAEDSQLWVYPATLAARKRRQAEMGLAELPVGFGNDT